MKKILSTLLVVAMLLTTMMVAVFTTAAAEVGAWNTYGGEKEHADTYDGDRKSIPGYEYTDDGLHVTEADWSTSSPYVNIQTTEAYDLKQGIFLEVRIDTFSYEASDKWFNFNIWSDVNLEPGSADPIYGEGVMTLVRPSGYVTEGEGENAVQKPGTVGGVAWYTNQFTGAGSSNMTDEGKALVDAETGARVLQLTVTWNGTTYAADINGAAAPEKVITYMNEKWGGEDSVAYIGFSMQNSLKGGIQSATITKFGTSKDTAEVPSGSDSKPNENFDNSTAAIADPSTVEAGQPAVFITGDKENSHLKSYPASATGAVISITEDFTIKCEASKDAADFGVIKVDNEVSYDVKDFPILMCVTKNFCTCQMGSYADCLSLERLDAYVLTGDEISPGPTNVINELDMCENATIVGEDSYLYFYVDLSDYDREGRFNGIRCDVKGVDLTTEGFNAFELCWVGLFKNMEEADAYLADYFESVGAGSEPDETTPAETTPAETTPAETTPAETTPAETTPAETTPAETTPEETKAPSKETQAPSNETQAPAGTEAPAEKSCGSFVGFGAIAVVVVAAAGMISFKKKED